MNITPLKKSIAKESVIFVIILVVIAALVLVISMLNDDYEQEKGKQSAATMQLLSEKQGLEEKYTKLQHNLELFEESRKRASAQGLFIASDAIGKVLEQYQNRLLLSKLSVNASPIMGIKDDANFVRPHFVCTKSTVKLELGALSDEDVYVLMRALSNELPGFVRFTSLKLAKKIQPNKESLAQIKHKGAVSLVEGEVSFDWYGLQSTKPDDPFNIYTPPSHEEKVAP